MKTKLKARSSCAAVLAAAFTWEAIILFGPTSVVRASGRRPRAVAAFGAGEAVGQTFRILTDALEDVSLQWSADRPAILIVAWRLLGVASGGWAPVHEGTKTLRLPRGRSTHRFAFGAIIPSEKRIYQFQVRQLDVRAADPRDVARPAVALFASRDAALLEGNLVLGPEQIEHEDLFLEARAASWFTQFNVRANRFLPKALRYNVVQLGLLVLYNWALAVLVWNWVAEDPRGAGESISSRLLSALRRRVRPRRLRSFPAVQDRLRGKRGLEIGGPSDVFAKRSLLPVYALASTIDNCVFSARTVWTGAIREGQSFVFDPGRAPGRQYIGEATDLQSIQDGAYDFVLASHAIEHMANPLGVLREWIRVLKDDGLLVLVVPHKEGTFDHRRPITPLAHLIDDDVRGTGEDDLTHLPEILALHDLALDPPAGDAEAFKARSLRNVENRCLHHHVFDTNAVVEMVNHVGLQIVAVEPVRPYHIVLIAQKVPPGRTPDNGRFRAGAIYRAGSPFDGDRACP